MMTAQLVTVTDETRQESAWLAFWRYLANRGDEPFPNVTLCPCGMSEEACECIRDDPGEIAHQIPESA